MYPSKEQYNLIKTYKEGTHTLTFNMEKLEKAVSHAVNYSSIDAETNTADYILAQKLAPQVLSYLLDITDGQILDRMTEEEKAKLFGPENQGDLAKVIGV